MEFLPPLLSIYLLVIAPLSSKYAKARVTNFLKANSNPANKELIVHLVLDWAARIGFINAMFAALISSFSISVHAPNHPVGVILFVILGGIFSAMMWWIMSKDPDELSSTPFRFGLKRTTFCRLVLIFVNVLLIGAIWYTKYYSASLASH